MVSDNSLRCQAGREESRRRVRAGGRVDRPAALTAAAAREPGRGASERVDVAPPAL